MERWSNSRWNFEGKEEAKKASACTIRSYLNTLREKINKSDPRSVIPLSHGDPSAFSCFRTAKVSEDALVDAVQSGKYNGCPQDSVILQARRSVAEYLSHDFPYELSPYDVHFTAGAKQGIDVLITALAVPGANILLPRPGYPMYEAGATFNHLEIRHYDLVPEQDWEVDINGLEARADDKTVAMVIINPGNPCGNVYKHEHLKKVVESIKSYLDISAVPPSLTMGAITRILNETPEDFYSNTINLLSKAADICYAGLREIPCFTCPYKPQGSMFLMAKVNMSRLEGIDDDMEFCTKLAREESVVVLPGEALGLKNWVRVTFAVEISALEDGLGRIKAFCFRNAKRQ